MKERNRSTPTIFTAPAERRLPSGSAMIQPLAVLKEAGPTISVGVLTAALSSLGSEVSLMEQAGVRMLHFDVMDGCFTPMMTFGPPLICAVKTSLLKDVHLMIRDPLEKIETY